MQLWEGNSKGKLLIKRVIDTILAKTSFWACIILLEKPEMDYSTSSLKLESGASEAPSYKSKAQRKRVLIWEEEQRS